jgi:bifunctional aspartokinase / homoserine dehydrogenase 1
MPWHLGYFLNILWSRPIMEASVRESRNHNTLVMKFGGTSVGSAEAIGQVVQISRDALATWPRVVVIVSAMSGVTDRLLQSATQAAVGDSQTFNQAAQELRIRHHMIADTLVSDLAQQFQVKQEINYLITDFINLCQAIFVLGEATDRAMDTVAALGERMCVRLVSGALVSAGIPSQYVEATQLIVTDDQFQSAHPDQAATTIATRQVLEPILAQHKIPVVTGFIGATPRGITTTLGRGGSDYSAALLGAALPADEVWIWTDVDGVMTADPRLVPEARTIPELSYREVGELAYFGAKVLHPKTIRPVIEAGISLRVCNTFNPDNPGTYLVSDQTALNDGVIKAVTAIRSISLVTLEGRGMLGVPGVAARTFGAVAATGVSVPLITQASSEQSICFAVPVESRDKVVSSLQKVFANEIVCRDIDRVWATDELVIVTVVGAGMRNIPGVSGRVFSALGNRNVNVIAIAQGSSEVSISLVIGADDIQAAVRAIHDLIVP